MESGCLWRNYWTCPVNLPKNRAYNRKSMVSGLQRALGRICLHLRIKW